MKIPLHDWAARQYDPPPSAFTLRRWAREGLICPMPEKVGKSYYVEESARVLTKNGAGSLIDRIMAA